MSYGIQDIDVFSLPETYNTKRLPNGIEIAYQSRAEVDFFYEDVFEHQVYLRNGITLRDGDCIFDVGANIGFFTLFAHQKCTPGMVYAFEPARPLFEILDFNTARYRDTVRVLNFGLSNTRKIASFTFYPHSSGMSSFYADKEEEKEVLRALMKNQQRSGMAGMDDVLKHAEDLLEERFRSETLDCELRTLSDVICEWRVGRIDLLKIDVQKSELDVLEGIGGDDWMKIQQIVIEVHDTDGRLALVQDLLNRNGYTTIVEQDDPYGNSIMYNVYATRRPSLVTFESEAALTSNAKPYAHELQTRARRQAEAAGRQKTLASRRKQGL